MRFIFDYEEDGCPIYSETYKGYTAEVDLDDKQVMILKDGEVHFSYDAPEGVWLCDLHENIMEFIDDYLATVKKNKKNKKNKKVKA